MKPCPKGHTEGRTKHRVCIGCRRERDRKRRAPDTPMKKNMRWAKRNAAKLGATPPWANQEAIKQFYVEARRLTAETGIPHEVDHIVPLQHPLVCGLHVETNLQVLTAEANNKKNNRWEPSAGPWGAAAP